MAYPNFGKVKTIVIPFTGGEDSVTLDEYKEKYGIDFRDFIKIVQGAIVFDFSNSLVLLSRKNDYQPDSQLLLLPAVIHATQRYSSGVTPAETCIVYLGLDDNLAVSPIDGLYFAISENDPLDIGNVKITAYNL